MIKRTAAPFHPSPFPFITQETSHRYVVMYLGNPVGELSKQYVIGLRDYDDNGSLHGKETLNQAYEKFQQGKSSDGYAAYAVALPFETNLDSQQSSDISILPIQCYYKADLNKNTGEIVWGEKIDDNDLKRFQNLFSLPVTNSSEDHVGEQNDQPVYEENFTPELTPEAYRIRFDHIQEDIKSGRYYEINYTQFFRGISKLHPWTVFKKLKSKTESRYAAWFPTISGAVLSASPELFFSISGNTIYTAPIKGSLVSREEELPAIPEKLSAEHIMVVDLARNDMGRISEYGTVRPDPLLAWEKYGRLRHLVTVVKGQLKKLSFSEIIGALHPAASITGTPKIEVLKAINEYEISPRGIYTGSLGWMDAEGTVSFNVAIRTPVANYDESLRAYTYEFGVGGAIVADSIAEEEYAECLAKARPILEIFHGIE